jgi:hypothetical protein
MARVFQNATGLTADPAYALDWDGPRPDGAASQLADGSVVLAWTAGAARVYLNGTQDCWECCDGTRALDTFQLSVTPAGPNSTNATRQAWVNTSWVFDGTATVTLQPAAPPPSGKQWQVVRYAASLWPQCAWYSASNDVPARSFSDLIVLRQS